jgi:hypothetical protein
MFIPVGQENNEVRRHPWVSYATLDNLAALSGASRPGT